MVDDVSLVSSSTTTYVSGTSGFNGSALIEAAVTKERAPVAGLEVDIENAQEEVAAYEEMQTLLGGMDETLDSLRNEPGTLGQPSVFENRNAYLSSDDGTTPTNYLGVSVADELEPATYNVEIVQVATAHKIGSDAQSSKDQPLGMNGSFSLGVGDKSADIALTPDMTLDDLKGAINSASSETGVNASILKVGDDEFRLVLSASDTGQDIQQSSVSGDDVSELLGLTDGGAVKNELQSAQDAIINVDGVQITRDSNSIGDAIEGVTLDLYGANPGTNITVEIDYDYASVKNALTDFVEQYNAYREFALVHQDIDSQGNIADTAVLYGDPNLQGVNNVFFDAMGETMEIEGEIYSLGNLGLSLNDENFLEIDEAKMDSFLLENIEVVQKMFEFQSESSSENLMVLSHENALPSGTYSFDIEVGADGEITSVSMDGDDSLFEVSGNTIKGVQGSAFEGLSLVFAGDTSETIELTLWQGLGDKMSDELNRFTDENGGAIQGAIEDLGDNVENMTAEIAEIEGSAAQLEARLVSYYANIEAKIAEAEALSAYLDAVYKTKDD